MANMPSGPLGQFCHDRGVVCYSAPNAQALKKALVAVGKARQIFIDTPDLSPSLGSQDPVISALINQRAGLTALLVMPATANSEFLDVEQIRSKIRTHIDSSFQPIYRDQDSLTHDPLFNILKPIVKKSKTYMR